jgi:hypothetical protein
MLGKVGWGVADQMREVRFRISLSLRILAAVGAFACGS